MLVWVFVKLNERGIFDADHWDIFIEGTEVWEALWRGLQATLKAAVVAGAIALIAGTLVAVARMSASPLLRIPAAWVIELFRGLPVLLLILFTALGFGASIFNSVVIGLALYNTAVIAEILRAGIQSLPGGQREAGLAIGLTSGQTLRLVQLPQAVRRMLPSLISQLVVLLKDTSLGYIVGYSELLRTSRELRDFFGSRYLFSIFIVSAAIYIGVNFALSRLATYLDRRSQRRGTGAAPSTLQIETGMGQSTGSI